LVRNAAEAAEGAASHPAVMIRSGSPTAERELQEIHILDNGPGISPDAAQKLFRPFFTTKINGTGLGLAVVQKILVQHGGQVEARNRPAAGTGSAFCREPELAAQRGAEFIVTLPAARAANSAVKSDKVAIED